MNSWGHEQFSMQNNLINTGSIMPNMMPSLTAPFVSSYMMGDMSQFNQIGPPVGHMGVSVNEQPSTIQETTPIVMNQYGGPMTNSQPELGMAPVQIENLKTDSQAITPDLNYNMRGEEEMKIPAAEKRPSREKSDRRDRDRDWERDRAGRNRRRSRSRNRDRSSRGERGDRNRSSLRERHTKWDTQDQFNTLLQSPTTFLQNQPTAMMQYGHTNMMSTQIPNPMGQQMDMSNIQMMQIPGMNLMSNMMMMNPQMQMVNQPIYYSTCVLLPPIPGVSNPSKRERPNGCRTIFVGGLQKGITEEVITEIFQRFGTIEEVKLHNGVCHVRFEKPEMVEMSFMISGYRLKGHDQSDNEATMILIDYALNRNDQNEYERNKCKRESTPPRVEPFTLSTFAAVSEKVKSDTEFIEAAPSLAAWLERGECNKKNANTFYSLIQASNNQLRRLFNEKMQIDEEFQTFKNTTRDKYAQILLQFEQIAKILIAAKHQRVSDHFSKQQRRNIEMWLKMTENYGQSYKVRTNMNKHKMALEGYRGFIYRTKDLVAELFVQQKAPDFVQELDNIKEEFNIMFDEDEIERGSKNVVSLEKYEQLRTENENLMFELEGYKNEAHLAKNEAERKFEKFKAHFIAQQALQNKQVYPPLPSPPMPNIKFQIGTQKPKAPDEHIVTQLRDSDAKLISLLSAFLMVHPQGASLDYLVSYVKCMVPSVTQMAIHDVLNKYSDVFCRKTTGVGASIDHKWYFIIFESVQVK